MLDDRLTDLGMRISTELRICETDCVLVLVCSFEKCLGDSTKIVGCLWWLHGCCLRLSEDSEMEASEGDK